MHKMWLVVKHEYLTNIRRRSFLFVAFGVPIFTIVMMAVVFGLIINNETDTTQLGTIGYVDQAGVLAQQIDKPENFSAYDTEAAARAALDAGTIGAYFILPPNYMTTGTVNAVATSGVPDALQGDINTYLRANLSTGMDPAIANRLKAPLNTSLKALDTGRVINESGMIGLILVPLIFVMIFLFASQTTSSYLMSGVVEEKTNRIMEILVTSITPFQLLMGKIIGLGALGLTQLVIWIIGGVITMRFAQGTEFLNNLVIPPDLLIVALIYFLLGYFMLSSVMAGIGAVIGSEQESRQLSGIFTLVMVIPFFAITSFINDPGGVAVTFLTLFPLTSPISVILRMGFGAIPMWELLLSMALLFLTGVLVAWASARIFRWALLLYGKRPGVRELIRVIRRAPSMATTATGDRAA